MAYGQGRTQIASALFSNAYGVDRVKVAEDTFDSSIGAAWENGGGDWSAFQWVSGGHIETATLQAAAALRRSAESYAADQYSKITVHAATVVSDIFIGASVRHAAGTDESAYSGGWSSVGSWDIWENNASNGLTQIATTADSGDPVLGDTITTEVEGTTIRVGSNQGGSDSQRLTTTDVTIVSGSPGLQCYEDVSGDTSQITAWEGGNIGFGNWVNGPTDGWQGGFEYVTGGHVHPTTVADSTAMRRSGESYDPNQYSKVTNQSMLPNGADVSSIEALVRMQSGSASGYLGAMTAAGDDSDDFFKIYEISSHTFTLLLETEDTSLPASSGVTLTLEVEGINPGTLRVGSDHGGSDSQRVTTTDSTWDAGAPGIGAFEMSASTEAHITAWEGGNIEEVSEQNSPKKMHLIFAPLRW